MSAPGPGPAPRWIDYGVAAATFADMAESGDHYTVQTLPDGLLIAVVDGLGHGHEAAVAARTAIAALEAARNDRVSALFEHCHRALRATRGAAMTVATIDARVARMTWLAVGNVEGLLLRGEGVEDRQREAVMTRGGIVGHRLPTLRPTSVQIHPGDLLILATDGIRDGFAHAALPAGAPQHIADHILAAYRKATDDALVLVGCWHGLAPGGAAP